MGWTSFEFHGTRVEFAHKEFGREPEHGSILDVAVVGSTVYIAYKLGPKHKEKEGKVTALIILTQIDRKDRYNFCYKDMDESCGPCQAQCPKRILKLLSPVEELFSEGSSSREYAQNWRNKCNDFHSPKGKPIAVGAIVKLQQPLKFQNGMEADTFKMFERNRWYIMNGTVETSHRVKFQLKRLNIPYEVLKAS